MNTSVALTSALIVLARITDVTLDTLRTAAIVQGRRVFAAALGFFEAVTPPLLLNRLISFAMARCWQS